MLEVPQHENKIYKTSYQLLDEGRVSLALKFKKYSETVNPIGHAQANYEFSRTDLRKGGDNALQEGWMGEAILAYKIIPERIRYESVIESIGKMTEKLKSDIPAVDTQTGESISRYIFEIKTAYNYLKKRYQERALKDLVFARLDYMLKPKD